MSLTCALRYDPQRGCWSGRRSSGSCTSAGTLAGRGRGGMVVIHGEPGCRQDVADPRVRRRRGRRRAGAVGVPAIRCRRRVRSARCTTSPTDLDDASRAALRRGRAVARDLRRRVRALRRQPTAARDRRPPLGRPGHRRPAAVPAPAHRRHPQHGGGRAARPRAAADRPPGAGAARRRRPLGRRHVDDAAPAEPATPSSRSPTADRSTPPGSSSSPAATRSSSPPCSSTTATSCPPRCATPSWRGPPTSTPRRGRSSTCSPARRRRSPTTCWPGSASGCRRCGRSTGPG